MNQYNNLVKDIIDYGDRIPTRAKLLSTGEHIDAISLIGPQTEYDLSLGFPLLTTKKINFKSIFWELVWFLNGDTNVKFLQEKGVKIWDEWADENGDIGDAYGKQWRAWPAYNEHFFDTSEHKESFTFNANNKVWRENNKNDESKIVFTKRDSVDQIQNLIAGIEAVKNDPTASVGRRLILSAWNVAEIDTMKLPPCHTLSQFFVRKGKLHCKLYQRSADIFLGQPFNVASYALLAHLLAARTGLEVGRFIHTFGDAHIYVNHLEQIQEQLSRSSFPLPTLRINRVTDDLKNLEEKDVELIGYKYHPFLKGEVAV